MMKRILTILMLLFASLSIFAQDAGDIYSKYSGRKGVSAVYVSPVMYQLVKVLPPIPIQGQEVDFSKLITDFQGMHFFTVSGAGQIAGFKADAKQHIKKYELTMLMESKEASGTTKIFIKQGDGVINTLVLTSETASNFIMTSINGKITPEALAQLIQSFQQK